MTSADGRKNKETTAFIQEMEYFPDFECLFILTNCLRMFNGHNQAKTENGEVADDKAFGHTYDTSYGLAAH